MPGKNMKYLIVVAHPDDETLGAGASIYKWTKQGDVVDVRCFFVPYLMKKEMFRNEGAWVYNTPECGGNRFENFEKNF